MKIANVFLSTVILFAGCAGRNTKSHSGLNEKTQSDTLKENRTLRVIYNHPAPVITIKSKGSEGIKFGFEGGRVVKVNNTYHLFTSELY
jgi:hypothetical protein